MTTDLKNSIEIFFAESYPNRENILVSQLSSISDGWESEMYSFIISYGPETSRRDEKLVLRIYPGDNALEKSQQEFTAMSRLFAAGYPVPRVFAIDTALTYIGRPFIVMQWIDGQVMWSMLDSKKPPSGQL
jgi:aminoglycoside phosphotransferase (APT) family kinase protein